MELWNWHRAALLTFAALPLALRAERAYRALDELPSTAALSTAPSLSIIVPARNEAHNLPELLASLNRLRYPGPVEIIVADDGSTDGTGDIAAAFGAAVVRIEGPPPGWLGKPHACHRGAEHARGEWLLFTDADLVHDPDGPRRAVAYSESHRLDAASLFVAQQYHNMLDRLALTVAFEALFAGRPPTNFVLNGQYILIRRSVYEASGGFAAVRNDALEDLALGRLLKGRRYRVALLRTESAAQVRMYADARQLWRGMTRLGAGALPWSGADSIFTVLFISAVMSPLIVATGVGTRRLAPRWLPLTWAAAALSTLSWTRRSGSSVAALLTPIGALLVQLAALWGLIARLLGIGVAWKERRV